MEAIKTTILAYLRKKEEAAGQEVSVPALDRYLVYVKQEDEYVGGKLLAILQEMLDEELIEKATGSAIKLTDKGRQA